jgi:hypothetical protein
VNRVLGVEIDDRDFMVRLGLSEPSGRVTADAIGVEPLEKARREFICVSGGIESINIQVTGVTVTLQGVPQAGDVQAATDAVVNAVNNFLATPEIGADLSLTDLKVALESLSLPLPHTLDILTITGNSLCDGRTQATDLVINRDIHVRSTEIPVWIPITDSDITVN